MLTNAAENKFIERRIFHDAWAGEAGERAMGISIPANLWPSGLKPVVKSSPNPNIDSVAPTADVITITYTTDEARAISYVFTGDHDFEKHWHAYGRNFEKLKPKITEGLVANGKPSALGKGTMAYLQLVTLNKVRVLLVKSETPPSRNCPIPQTKRKPRTRRAKFTKLAATTRPSTGRSPAGQSPLGCKPGHSGGTATF